MLPCRGFLILLTGPPAAGKTVILFVADSLFALNPLTLLAAVGCAGGLYLFVRGFRLLARKRLLLNSPTSKIRSASLGLVEVSGLATGPYTIPAPITGKPCYLYRTTAWRQRDTENHEWKKIAEETLHVPFFLDDSTGKLLVDPAGADLDLHRDFCEKYDQTWTSQVPERATSFLARHGIAPEGDHFRIEEWTIQPQNPLFIVGTLAENPGIEVRQFSAGYRPNRTSIGLQQPSTPQQQVVRLSETPTPVSAGDDPAVENCSRLIQGRNQQPGRLGRRRSSLPQPRSRGRYSPSGDLGQYHEFWRQAAERIRLRPHPTCHPDERARTIPLF